MCQNMGLPQQAQSDIACASPPWCIVRENARTFALKPKEHIAAFRLCSSTPSAGPTGVYQERRAPSAGISSQDVRGGELKATQEFSRKFEACLADK